MLSRGCSLTLHPVVITALCVWVAWKLAPSTIPITPGKTEDTPKFSPATEPLIENESNARMAYQAQSI